MTGALFNTVISSLSYGRSKFGPKSEEFCYAFARVPKIGYGVVIIWSMRWPFMHHNMMRLLQNIDEKFGLL